MAAQEVRLVGLEAGEEATFARAVTRGFFEDESDEELQTYLPLIERDRVVTARQDDAIVGTFAIRSATISTPGGEALPCAGVTAVTVEQTHRRRGVLRGMMTRGLDAARERDEPVAALYASEGPIYGRFGFGVSAPQQQHRIDAAGARVRDPVDVGLVESASVPRAVADWPAILEAGVRERRGGCLDRREAYWRAWLEHDPPGGRSGASARRLVHVPGRGYAAYRVEERYTDVLPAGTVRLQELVATDPEAEQALWQHLLDVDLTTTVEAWLRPADDPLAWMLTDRLRARSAECAPLYTSLLDVPGALTARGYHVRDALVLEIHEPAARAVTYRLDAGPDGASCERVDAEPDLAMPLDVLSAAWLGGVGVCQLRDARRLEERRSGAAARLDALLAVDLMPWTPFEF